MRVTFLLIILFIFSSCATSVRMKYEATIVDDLFHQAQFEFYKSYVGNTPSQEILAIDARNKLNEIFGENNFKHNNIKISNFGSSDLPEDYNFPTGQPLVNHSPFTYKEKIIDKKSSSSN